MGKVLPLSPESGEDWYEAIISTHADEVGPEEIDRDKFNHAFEAFMAGSYDTAYKQFGSLSKAGSSVSPYYLGLMCLNGMGVLQDYCRSHMWLNIASSRGHKKARAQLEKLTKNMSADQLANAQRLARRWLTKLNKAV
jgi:TPR repeat protein